jgi:hypothetical protein
MKPSELKCPNCGETADEPIEEEGSQSPEWGGTCTFICSKCQKTFEADWDRDYGTPRLVEDL